MRLRKLVGLAVCLFVSVSASAQNPVEMFEVSRINRISTKSLPMMKKAEIERKQKAFIPLNETFQNSIKGGARSARAAAPVAYYEVESGVYTLVPDMMLSENSYTNNGFLVPLNTSIEYKYVDTGLGSEPIYFDWLVGQDSYRTKSIVTSYTPYVFVGEDEFTTYTPELYVGNNFGEDTYSAGTLTFSMSDGTTKEIFGMIPLLGAGWVSNLDVNAYPGLSTSLLYYDGNDPWNSIFFGTETEYKSAYMEFYDAPKGGYASVQGNYIPVLTPNDVDLTNKTFALAYAEDQNGQLMIKHELEVSGENSIIKRNVDEENGVTEWLVFAVLEEPIMMKGRWAVLVQGPQDGTKWAMRCQVDRMDDGLGLNDDKVTSYQVYMEGEYAGYITPAVSYSVSNNETKAYPTSLDLYTYVSYPWMSIATDSYLFADTIPSDAVGGVASAMLASWGMVEDLEVISDTEWLTCTTSPYIIDGETAEWLLNIEINVLPLPENVAGRMGHLTFTDKEGYTKIFTVVQGDAAAGIDDVTVAQPVLDPYAPVYDLTGRLVSNPVKGIYLQNGKKIVVK